MRYGFTVTESDGKVLKDLKNQKADDGTGIQQMTFENEGPKDIEVTVEAVGGTAMGEFVESSKFGIIAQPSTGGNTTAAATGENQTGNATTVSPAG